ncbi:MAG: GNAT family N-acetyltransferase [Terriglobales bacterium]
METEISLRVANASDAAALACFAAETFRFGCPPGTAEEDLAAFIATELTPDRFRTFIGSDAVTIWVAEARDQLAGYLMLVRGSKHEWVKAALPAEIRKVYVHPEYHGRGVAETLMRAALGQIDNGHDVAWLSVFSKNARAIAFYRMWGFEVIGRHTFMVGRDAQEDFFMQRFASREQ